MIRFSSFVNFPFCFGGTGYNDGSCLFLTIWTGLPRLGNHLPNPFFTFDIIISINICYKPPQGISLSKQSQNQTDIAVFKKFNYRYGESKAFRFSGIKDTP